MSILGKSVSTLIKAANDGNIGAIDKLADSVSSFDMSKIKTLARDKQKKAKDFTNLSKEMRETKHKEARERTSMRAHIKLYDDLIMMADELCIKVAIENDITPFTSAAIYRTSNEMVTNFESLKKTFYALDTKVDNFANIKKEYSAIILKLKNAERDAVKHFKAMEQYRKKVTQLNTSIEGLKK